MGAEGADPRRALGASRRVLQITEHELQRILLDIHDGPVQYMYAALSQVELMRRALAAPAEHSHATIVEPLDRIQRLLEDGLNEVRSFIGAFRPPEFAQADLRALLEGLVLQHEASTDTAVELRVEGELPRVDVALKIALFRVLQEALSNAYRHGGASRVVVRLAAPASAPAHLLRLEVEDDGAGFDPGAGRPPGHYGLDGMRDRIEMIGGAFRIRSAPGQGTLVVVEVPLE